MTLVAENLMSDGTSTSMEEDTGRLATKNSEHESGYFEDGSDVEERRRTAKQSAESSGWSSSSCSRSCGLTKAINELDVRDSPASPDPDDDEEYRRNDCQEGERKSRVCVCMLFCVHME